MSKFIHLYKNKPSDTKFFNRYAASVNTDDSLKEYNIKSEFETSYKKGSVKLDLASKYMKLVDCGLNRYVEASSNSFWAKEGEQIVRVSNNLDWVDEYLKEQDQKNEIQ